MWDSSQRSWQRVEYSAPTAYFFTMAYSVFFVWSPGAGKPHLGSRWVKANLEVITPWQYTRAKSSECFFRNTA